MNNTEMKKFYDLVIGGDKHEQVKALVKALGEMFDQIPNYFLHRQVDDYNVHNKREPFGRVKTDIPNNQLVFDDWRCNGKAVGIVLFGSFVEAGQFVWSFLDNDNKENLSVKVRSLLTKSELLKDYSNHDTWPDWPHRYHSRLFAPPTNPKAIQEIRAFLDNTLMKLRRVTLADIE